MFSFNLDDYIMSVRKVQAVHLKFPIIFNRLRGLIIFSIFYNELGPDPRFGSDQSARAQGFDQNPN